MFIRLTISGLSLLEIITTKDIGPVWLKIPFLLTSKLKILSNK